MESYRLHTGNNGVVSRSIYKPFLLLCFTLCSFTTLQQKEQAKEYNLKAAFIYNFTKYIEWKESAEDNEFIIGILGDSPINGPLAEIVKTETVDNKRITIKRFSKASDISFCHILFISNNTSIPLDDIIDKTNGKGTLIISEQDGYAEQGAALNFVIVNRKLKFEANVKAINAAGLTASSQLLKLAIIIK
jgi:hypothetical protein